MNAGELLGPSGPFAQSLPGYEARLGQIAMAEAVERTLAEDRVLLAEAGTGTGKTLAYLVPAIQSGRKVVVSTATRALQEQIFHKDIPLIERALGRPVHAALMKGLSNYVCRRRFQDFRTGDDGGQARRLLPMLEGWVAETETGDVAELASLSEDDPALLAITSSSETRVGSSCRFHDECFVTRMKRESEAAQILVVNHHLFFADLALRGAHPGRVIPDYDAVIFDEAQKLEDTATLFFGVRVSEARLSRLFRDVDRALAVLCRSDPLSAGSVLAAARTASVGFFDRIVREAGARDDRVTLERDFWNGERAEAWHRLDEALDGVRALGESLAGQWLSGSTASGASRKGALAAAEALTVAARRAQEIRLDLATIVDGAKGRVTWLDGSGRSPSLSSSPVDVSPIFRSYVFEAIPAVVLTSATLASGPHGHTGPKAFSFVRSRLGLSGDSVLAHELVVPSPFDYAARSLLYLPRDLPPPSDPAFIERAAERIAQLVDITGGGAFVLTTSVKSTRAIHRLLRARFSSMQILMQGEAPKSVVLARFRDAGNAVLVATSSFWQGVDVPGHALRLVVLEKIPFPVPTEPVIKARAHALEEEGRNAFVDLHVPLAKIALKQGFGRLIRTRKDRGIVALFDERVHRRPYGRELLSALPPSVRTSELAEAREFFERETSPVADFETDH